jgi:hypothetical protein
MICQIATLMRLAKVRHGDLPLSTVPESRVAAADPSRYHRSIRPPTATTGAKMMKIPKKTF